MPACVVRLMQNYLAWFWFIVYTQHSGLRITRAFGRGELYCEASLHANQLLQDLCYLLTFTDEDITGWFGFNNRLKAAVLRIGLVIRQHHYATLNGQTTM